MSNLFAQFTADGQRVLNNARRVAKKHKRVFIDPEHLLMGVLQLSGSQAELALKALHVNLDNLSLRLAASIKLSAKQPQEDLSIGYAQGRIKLSHDSKIIVTEAIAEAEENQVDFIDTRLLVLGMLRHTKGTVAGLLHQYGITLETFRAQAQLKEVPPINRPRFEGATQPLSTIPIQLSPIFVGLILVGGAAGYLAYAGIGHPSPPVFFFVICGWVASVALHEFGHALVAFWGGDESVVHKGYLTLDPLKYTHPFLSIVLPVIFLIMGGIGLPGGAVYIHPTAIRSRTMRSLASAAGPIASALCALICAFPLFFLGSRPELLFNHLEFWAGLALLTFLEITAIFLNLLPIPGLDGFGILEPFLPPEILQKANLFRPFTFFLLYGLLFLDTPLRTEFWQGVWQVTQWINADLGFLVSLGFELFRFWAG